MKSAAALVRAILFVVYSTTNAFTTSALAEEDLRAADGEDVVLKRLYPKMRSVELEAGAGFILNPTFVDTLLAEVSVRYHWSEAWGIGVGLASAHTKDRDERACVEAFYNDPEKEASAECVPQDDGAAVSQNVNIGPAYVPIRELSGMVKVFGDYTIAYGKQIMLHGAVNHFDLRVRFGGGLVLSQFYEERQTIRDSSRPSRGDPEGENGAPRAGVGIAERDDIGLLYGEDGRPGPREEMSPALFLGLVQELHFARRFFLAGELGGYVMTSQASGIDPFLVAHVGFGMRL